MTDDPGNDRKAFQSASGPPGASPDEVLRLLETCQLTDQDTDELLKDAYALNRLLRAHLAHVESPAASTASSAASGGGRSFGQRQLSGPERHEQTASRRSASLSGRPTLAAATQPQQQRLPPIRARSPGQQRLSEMARVYSTGVIQPGHRAGAGSVGGAANAGTSSKKRL